jgi:hypothetical protein
MENRGYSSLKLRGARFARGRLAERRGAERRGTTDGTEDTEDTEDTDGEGGHLKVGLQDVGRGGLLTERGAGIV